MLLLGNGASLLGRNLGGVSGALLGAAETAGTSTAGNQYSTLRVGKGNDGVVEGCLNVNLAGRYASLKFFFLATGTGASAVACAFVVVSSAIFLLPQS